MRVVTCGQMKEAEQYAVERGVSALRLMENAGSAAARFIRENFTIEGKRCAVLCGRGNNGGDGFVVARRLIESGALVTVILAAGSPKAPNAAEMFERLKGLPVTLLDYQYDSTRCTDALDKSSLIIDAVFGTGFSGQLTGQTAKLITAVNKYSDRNNAPVIALDMPSGADAETGEVAGSCVRAEYTVTFAAPKTGQLTFPAAEYCGIVRAVNIGIPPDAFDKFIAPVELLEEDAVKSMLPKRAKDSNKGDYGKLYCLCGSLGMAGAAAMPVLSALRCGAGIVTAGVPKSIYSVVASKLNEALVYPLEETGSGSLALSNLMRLTESSEKGSALLIGCGLSHNPETVSLIRELVRSATCPVVLDADGINAFEGHIDILRESKAELILTPHPGEMARIIGRSIAEVQASRLRTAAEFAADAGVTLVLKGAYTVIAGKTGSVWINPTGNPGMARGGSGDILAGMVASFAAQGFTPESAACSAAYLHGLAGDRCAQRLSQYGMLPTDMLMEIPQIFRDFSR